MTREHGATEQGPSMVQFSTAMKDVGVVSLPCAVNHVAALTRSCFNGRVYAIVLRPSVVCLSLSVCWRMASRMVKGQVVNAIRLEPNISKTAGDAI